MEKLNNLACFFLLNRNLSIKFLFCFSFFLLLSILSFVTHSFFYYSFSLLLFILQAERQSNQNQETSMSKVARSIHEITPTTTELIFVSMLPPILWFNIIEFIFTHPIAFTDKVISAEKARGISEALKTNCSITNITLYDMNATYILLNSLSLTLNCVFHMAVFFCEGYHFSSIDFSVSFVAQVGSTCILKILIMRLKNSIIKKPFLKESAF